MKLTELVHQLRNHAASTLTEISLNGKSLTISFRDIYERVMSACQRLNNHGIRPGQVIALHGPNSIDYVIWDLAATELGVVLLAIPEEFDIITATALADEYNACLLIVEDFSGASGRHVLPIQLATLPEQLPIRSDALPDHTPDLHTKVFSSGTAGKLKGLNISRSGTEYVLTEFIKTYEINETDQHLIFLPFSNYQQRMSLYGCIYTGVSIIVSPYQRVFEAMRNTRPSFLIAPPVFFETALQLQQKSSQLSLPELFGGNIRFLITGMAPIKLSTLNAYWKNGLTLYDAYGLTETGMVAWNSTAAHRLGSVGYPLDRTHIVLNEDDEIIIKRPHPLSLGYFKADADDNFNTFTENGIATGDYGSFDHDGYLHLTGRKKDIIVLNNGKKFHPREVEENIRQHANIKDVIVAMNKPGSHVIAIVPIPSNQISSTNEASVRDAIIQSNNRLDGYKRVAQIIFTDIDVFRDARFVTRNMKLNRKTITSFFC